MTSNMVKVLKISKIGGEKVRKKLIEKGVLDASYVLGKTGNFLLFPLKKTRGIVKEFGGKLVDRKRFVVVIVCILFGSPGFMNNAFGIWRHTFALLVFFIGIVSR